MQYAVFRIINFIMQLISFWFNHLEICHELFRGLVAGYENNFKWFAIGREILKKVLKASKPAGIIPYWKLSSRQTFEETPMKLAQGLKPPLKLKIRKNTYWTSFHRFRQLNRPLFFKSFSFSFLSDTYIVEFCQDGSEKSTRRTPVGREVESNEFFVRQGRVGTHHALVFFQELLPC